MLRSILFRRTFIGEEVMKFPGEMLEAGDEIMEEGGTNVKEAIRSGPAGAPRSHPGGQGILI
ncbi:hypothetical protein ZOSMA_68G00900 [Zostera marina]|uniref:Uncharacterized protein n=1 Tax=Zostera marina TaxID=29655 RepID=A0A0K9NTW5_ZOSMR|nr:hypothetical protein ZOSMA_68G00900 [Zostera marina]